MMRSQKTAIRAAASILLLGAVTAPAAAEDVKSRAQELWRTEIAKTPVTADGCFKAEYPSKTWTQVQCVNVPAKPFRHSKPASGSLHNETVGGGDDYTAVGNGIITGAIGSFPSVKGLKSEDDDGANIYSLQLNSEFFSTSECQGASVPTQCQAWAQFVYSSGEASAFIQYWLINYGDTCPTTPYNDWTNDSGSCFRNSPGVTVPAQVITTLPTMKVAGTANASRDNITFVVGGVAYKAGSSDNVVFLSSNWTSSEFNVFGDAGGSQGNFNSGTKITVQIVQYDKSGMAPTCLGESGTTAETTNLTLGACIGKYNTAPFINFAESH